MAVYVNNISINSGANFYRDFYLDDVNGNSLDLTGYTGKSEVRKHPESVGAATTFSLTFVDRPNGRIRLSLTRPQTEKIKPGRYCYDVMFTEANSQTDVGVWSTLEANNPGSYRGHTNVGWSSFMNTYAYSRVPQSGSLSSQPDPYGVKTDSYTVFFPYNGVYQIDANADNVGSITINSTTFTANIFSATNPGVGTISLTRGNHTVTLTQQNLNNGQDDFADNPVGIAASISYVGGTGYGKKSIVIEGNILVSPDITPQCVITSYTNESIGAISEDSNHDSGIGSGLTQTTIDQIGEYGVVAFGHYSNACVDLPGLTTKFQDSTYMADIQSYLAMGGVVLYIGEYGGCGSIPEHNTRLGLLGTSMRLLDVVSGSSVNANLQLTNSAAASFPATWNHSAVGQIELNSGTALYGLNQSTVTVAYEKIGVGAIVLVADSNGSTKTPQNHYDGLRELIISG